MYYIILKIKQVLENILDKKRDAQTPNLKSPFINVSIQDGCNISQDSFIGEYTYIGVNTTVTKAVIGRYCSIANNVSIGDGEHIIERVSTNSIFYDDPYGILTQKECIIGNDVWIGTKSVIRRGVKIGDGAVIGANSFVNKDVPAYGIFVGSPAKLLKYRFSERIINLISESKWWQFDYNKAKIVVKELQKEIENI